jgi:hypothetical protein
MTYRDPRMWERIYVRVESGKIVSAAPWNPELVGKSFDPVSQWVLRESGDMVHISRRTRG